MIRFERVYKRFLNNHYALNDISLEIEAGAMAFITGHSGAGKTTLMRLIALLDRPTRGQVMVDGKNIGRLPKRTIPYHRRKIGMIYQDNKLLSELSVYDNVALPLHVSGTPWREIGKRVRALLSRLGLKKYERSTPLSLSSGEQRRVSIARALVTRPPILLADEPTGNLDPDLSLEIMNLFLAFNQVGITMLVATHDLALVKALQQPLIRLYEGKLQR